MPAGIAGDGVLESLLFLCFYRDGCWSFEADHRPKLLLTLHEYPNGPCDQPQKSSMAGGSDGFAAISRSPALIVLRYPICNELCFQIIKSQFERGLGLCARFPNDNAEGADG